MSQEFTHTFRVRFAETDQMGIVHHSVHAVWLEAARVEWLRALGLSYRDLEDAGVSLAVSELQVRYQHAARFDDLLGITARLTESRSRRLKFSYTISRAQDGQTIGTAQTVHVPVDRTGRAIRLPGEWLAALEGLRAGSD